ncbi:bifunctional aminoglycoside phosphotransferase/ATP-binding protein [Thermomonospora cellulosilytica]|uniref:Aminoglycoside phosphotransferase family enzyme/predicted kinase n=1 Tax=Thermomonospora cellulosilytica TaxID=1411118 RepID=A0A7W3MVT4_9ACTN|nr:AAA family ATPase [Thermomonospora cellulosilytica]MBA9002793.1 aminoglycoside phosphotransferase family enzyme/predicted kinase [Thermomonospora cellulosilytica]
MTSLASRSQPAAQDGTVDERNAADAPAAVSETHIGLVFFAAGRAYKVKKPVDLGFVDLTTPAERERVCRREVELNRRFAPDVYLGVGTFRGLPGEADEPVVVMRRMPTERRLSTLVHAREPVDDALRAIARRLAAWHAIAPRGPQIAAQGSRDALRRRWCDSFDQVRPFHGRVLPAADAVEIEERTLRFLAGREALFEARIRDGRVVDGHGDLMATDVFCLPDGPRILDCLEFDDQLRWLDGLDDAAFLAMDLERLGAPALGERFLRWYAEYAADPAPASLRHHYTAYRAFVRAKVACLRHAQGDPQAGAEAARLAGIALRHLRAGAARLILVGGLPGTGKSSLARELGDRLGCAVINSDVVRKELADLSPDRPAAAPFGEGIYRPEHTERTYATMLVRAETLLNSGESVILDASWTAAEHRTLAELLARRVHADLTALRCQAPADLTARRLRERTHGPSDADPAIAAAMASRYAPWPEAAVIDTGDTVAAAVEQALQIITPYGPVLSQIAPD